MSADFSRTCKGCKHVRRERVSTANVVYRCFAEGPRKGRTIGDGRQFLPYVPAWCPEKNARSPKLRLPKEDSVITG